MRSNRSGCVILFLACAVLPWVLLHAAGPVALQDTTVADAKLGTAPLPSTASLPRDYPVITVRGICPPAPARKSAADCKTVVTRVEFERLVDALNPAMTKFERRQLADNYAQILTLSHEAIKQGLDKDPRVQEKLRYTRLRILAGEMAGKIYEKSTETPSAEAVRYYEQNKESFRRYSLQRIFVPREKQGAARAEDPEKAAAEMRALAENIRARAAAGEDFAKLQKEAIAASGITGEVSVSMNDISRRGLPQDHQQVLDLGPGKVSTLITDDNGYYIYRVVSSEIPSFATVRKQVLVEIQGHKQGEALGKIQEAAKKDVNEAYFDKYDPPPAKEAESDVEDD